MSCDEPGLSKVSEWVEMTSRRFLSMRGFFITSRSMVSSRGRAGAGLTRGCEELDLLMELDDGLLLAGENGSGLSDSLVCLLELVPCATCS